MTSNEPADPSRPAGQETNPDYAANDTEASNSAHGQIPMEYNMLLMPNMIDFNNMPKDGNAPANVSSDGTSNKANPSMMGSWMMEGYYPFQMIPPNTFMHNNGMMLSGSFPSFSDKSEPGNETDSKKDAKLGEDNPMQMYYYMPPIMMDNVAEPGKEGTQPMQPNCIMPMFPFMQTMPEDSKMMLDFGKMGMPSTKVGLQRKISDATEHIKNIPTSVHIRETCQLKAWRKRLQRSKSLYKMDSEHIIPVNLPIDNEIAPDNAEVQDKTDGVSDGKQPELGLQASALKKHVKDMEIAWMLNRFGSLDDLSDSDLKGFKLFDEDDLSEDILEIKKSLKYLSTLNVECYPYQLIDQPQSFIKNRKKDTYSLWTDESDVSSDVEVQEQDKPELVTSVIKEPQANQDVDDLEDLEEDLLDGIAPDNSDLDDEFDFEVPERPKTLTESTFKSLNQENVVADLNKEVKENDLNVFGEIPDTLSYDIAKLTTLLDGFDAAYEWRKFREGLDHDLKFSDFVEFDQSRRLLMEKKAEEIKRMLNVKNVDYNDTTDDSALINKLYCSARANMKLLLNYKHPEVLSLINSSIYDLNATNTIYFTLPDDDINTPKVVDDGAHLSKQDTVEKDEAPEESIENNPQEDCDEPLLQGKDSDVRRYWRRRLQTLGKETRLALVNMGKSLKYIDSVFVNIEQSRTYDSVVEFCEVATMFRNLDLVKMLNHSFDDVYAKNNPHDTGKEDEVLNRRELVHTRVAKNLTSILPLVGHTAKLHHSRFHRLDFRTDLFDAHLIHLRGGYSPEWSPWVVRPVVKSVASANFKDDDIADGSQNHPSNYFIHSSDLSLADDCKVALFEYIEQNPLLLSNCGMTSRVDNYVNSIQESGDQNMISLGPLGTMIPTSDGVELFGITHNIKPGEGQSILENTLFRAPIFVHPRPGTVTCKSNISTTDFLLIKSRDKDSVSIRLRPLTWQDNVAVYTVGQCEPKLEVSSPNSKSYLEDTKNLLKAWALKSVMTGKILDNRHLRKEACRQFYPAISEKEIGHVLKQLESNPIFSTRPQALELMIHSTIKPELVCSLESTRAGKYRLKSAGILKLKNPDRISAVYAKVHQEEKQSLQRLQSAEKRRKELRSSYSKRLEARGITGEKLEEELKQFNIDVQCSIYGHLDKRTIAPQIKFIEELLKLSPWNITRDVKQVLNNKDSAQFALYGFADPSGGRGEAINLLKRQVRDSTVETSSTGEDLRKLSMDELAKRLTRYGVSEAVIKTLPRWDQVALVRQYRDGFGGNTLSDGDNRWRIPPEEYRKKLNNILLRQREALQSDEPDISDDAADENSEEEDKKNIADAFLEAMDDESDKDDDLEMHELEILRQLRETQNAGFVSEEEKMAEDNKLKAVPGVMWLRQSRKTPTEPFGNERAVFIYGEENIKKVLKWRRECALKNKTLLPTELILGVHGTGKRICRSCGQVGHIASNPKCPLYRGDKIRHDTYHPTTTVHVRTGPGRRPFRDSESSDGEITASTAALNRDTTDWLLSNLNSLKAREKRKNAKYTELSDEGESVDEVSLIIRRRKTYRMYDSDDSNIISHYGTDDRMDNTSENLETIMKIVSKVVRMMEKESRFKPFIARIPESIAPNYYKIIKNPMWLALLKVKIKSKCYKNITQFLNDLALIEFNCKQFNSEASPNAWLRQMSEVLVDEIIHRLQQMLSQHMQISILDYWMDDHKSRRREISKTEIKPSVSISDTVVEIT